jgi:hypothetical protein
MTNWTRRAALGLLLAGGLSACSDRDETSSLDPSLVSSSTDVTLVECPSNTSYSTSGTVLPLGGSVSLRGHSVAFPAGALLLPATIGLTEPASQFMQIDLSANGADHYQFEAPLTVTISYARCSRANIDKGPLSVWLIDETTGELLANMGGVDDKLTRTITFETDHFSGYAIAN